MQGQCALPKEHLDQHPRYLSERKFIASKEGKGGEEALEGGIS